MKTRKARPPWPRVLRRSDPCEEEQASPEMFRGWDGRRLVFDLAVDQSGFALRPSGNRGRSLVYYRPERSWSVDRHTGFHDRAESPIFENDVVAIGSEGHEAIYAVVKYLSGRFVVIQENQSAEVPPIALAKYCNSIFRRMILVVGTAHECRWAGVFGQRVTRALAT